MLDRIDVLEQKVRELQARMGEVVDSLREMTEAKAAMMLDRSEDEARTTSPPDGTRRK